MPALLLVSCRPYIAGMNQFLRLILELGPLVVFFLVNAKMGIFWATGVFMAVTPVALSVNYMLEKRLPVMPLVVGVMVLVFGGLTLILADETFIKLKPTIVNVLFACALFAGLALKRNFLKIAFQAAFQLDDEGWRLLTWRWAFFFLVLAGINEIVWRTQTTDFWVTFKVFGIMPLTLAFTLTQLPLIFRHQVEEVEDTP